MPRLIKTGNHLYEPDALLGDVRDDRANARVKIGGNDPSRFIPNINASKWGDRVFMNINAGDFSFTLDDSFGAGDVVQQVIGNIALRWYIDARGRLEYETVFASRPAKTSYSLDVLFTEGLYFALQPESDEDEIETMGYIRPPEEVGAYAVYWLRRNNAFKTGKFCHVMPPYLVDKAGKRVRVDLFEFEQTGSTTGKFHIDLPKSWLQHDAVYPVTLDPVIGYDTAGGSAGTSAGRLYSSHDTSAGAGTGDTIHAYIDNNKGSSSQVKLALYASAGNYPSDMVEPYATVTVPSADGEVSGAYSPAIDPATKYWIAVCPKDNPCEVRYDTGAPANSLCYYNYGSYSSALPDPWPNPGTNYTYLMSIWIEYTESGGAAVEITTSDAGSSTEVTDSILTAIRELGISEASSASEVTDVLISAIRELVQSDVSSATQVTDAVISFLRELATNDVSTTTQVENIIVQAIRGLSLSAVSMATEISAVVMTVLHALAESNVASNSQITDIAISVIRELGIVDIGADTQVGESTLLVTRDIPLTDIQSGSSVAEPSVALSVQDLSVDDISALSSIAAVALTVIRHIGSQAVQSASQVASVVLTIIHEFAMADVAGDTTVTPVVVSAVVPWINILLQGIETISGKTVMIRGKYRSGIALRGFDMLAGRSVDIDVIAVGP